jgi:hypothetical protein
VMLNNAVFQAGALTSTRALSYLLSPLICILLITISLVTLANAVDEFFNPRLRRAAGAPAGAPGRPASRSLALRPRRRTQ